jgi:arylsulfatase A-like enzyme
MNVILILLDSLNKDYLSCYGNEWISTPNIQKLADKSLVYNNHYIGSAPCMPARREIFTGRKEFMWRGWGQSEPFDDLLPAEVEKTGAYTAIVTDHYHYWDNVDGYGYIQEFDNVNMVRGAVKDRWNCDPIDESNLPKWVNAIKKYRKEEDVNRFYNNVKNCINEEDFQSPKVMSEAASWLDKNCSREKFFLMIEGFDPHEPWYIPEPYRSMYGEYSEEYTCWPPYQREEARERFRKETTKEEIEFLRNQYAGNVTMVDTHLKKVFDVMDRKNLWDNTAVILTTDHGHELFERERFGKSFPQWNTNANIPLIIWHPEYAGNGKNTEGFSTTVDIYSTILDIMGSKVNVAPNGKSQMPVVKGDKESVRDAVLYGTFASGACMCDGKYTYFCGYDNTNPIYWYSSHLGRIGVRKIEEAEGGNFIPGVDIPVWRYPCSRQLSDIKEGYDDMLFKFEDKSQSRNIVDTDVDGLLRCKEKLVCMMEEEGVPPEQYVRLGLKKIQDAM